MRLGWRVLLRVLIRKASSRSVSCQKLVVIAIDDAAQLGVLSSRIHVVWALAQAGTLEDRPRYTKSQCFDPFPFPDANSIQSKRSVSSSKNSMRTGKEC
ncbi:type IIL restriction-modification enzyme MmeI [Bradyrhizobium sp. 197]|uniref:type IIL restriction-modification enzyme MmeI n=1 Tax=Bradyrhizobium sp. 197 TaxID=2782663 RepID=UPI0031F612A8